MADGANSGLYNAGKANILGLAFANGTITEAQHAGAAPATTLPGGAWKLYSFDNGGTSAVEGVDHDDYADLTTASAAESTGGGYGENDVSRNSTDFDNLTVDDATNDRGELQMADESWTASGSSIVGMYYAVLTDANTTQNDRALYVFWGLGNGGHTVTDGSTLTVQNAEVRIA